MSSTIELYFCIQEEIHPCTISRYECFIINAWMHLNKIDHYTCAYDLEMMREKESTCCSIIIQENMEFDQRANQHKDLDSRLRRFHNGECHFDCYHFYGKQNFRAAVPQRGNNVTNTRDWLALKFRWISFIGYFYIHLCVLRDALYLYI